MASCMDVVGYVADGDILCPDCYHTFVRARLAEGACLMEHESPVFGDNESDSPNHCGECSELIDGELTSDGVAYVIDQHLSNPSEITEQWLSAFGISLPAEEEEPIVVDDIDTARLVAGYWHSGQWSAFYAFSSSGFYNRATYLAGVQELHSYETRNPSPGKDHAELKSLVAWLEANTEEPKDEEDPEG